MTRINKKVKRGSYFSISPGLLVIYCSKKHELSVTLRPPRAVSDDIVSRSQSAKGKRRRTRESKGATGSTGRGRDQAADWREIRSWGKER